MSKILPRSLNSAWPVSFRYARNGKAVGELVNGIAVGPSIEDTQVIIDCTTGELVAKESLWDFHSMLSCGAITFTITE